MGKSLALLSVLLSCVTVILCGSFPVNFLGGGNFHNGNVDDVTEAQFTALYLAGASNCRMTLDPYHYYNNVTNQVVLSLDQAILQASRFGMTPFVLFEHDSDIVGDYSKWFSIGKAFAERYNPNSEWLLANNISDFGISVFSAFDEPELTCMAYEDYYFAILGLADGVHSVDPSLSVIPGGFSYPSTEKDWTLNGFGPTLAPLWNNGTLDGIDLHTIYDATNIPIAGSYSSSAQSNFDMVKKACSITREINFYSTKWTYKRSDGESEEMAEKAFLTAYWDSVGVVKGDGSSATRASFVYGLLGTSTYDLTPSIEHGDTLSIVQSLILDSQFTLQDPKDQGVYKLVSTDKSRVLVVWQNRPFWSSLAGPQFTLDLPKWDKDFFVDVYTWDGLYLPMYIPAGYTNYTFEKLPEEETFMFLIYPYENDGFSSDPCSSTASTGSTTNSESEEIADIKITSSGSSLPLFLSCFLSVALSFFSIF